MKIAILSLAALAAVAMAAPGAHEVSAASVEVSDAPEAVSVEAVSSKFDGNIKCSISNFSPSFSKISECCPMKTGGSDLDKKSTLKKESTLKCRLPIGREGLMCKCVKDLGFSTAANCDY
ncbi:hypothetical protein BGZ93_004832 [Podila epicladia]|nr:hypothetical protein BGZ93_004832 [Podila epicladia]